MAQMLSASIYGKNGNDLKTGGMGKTIGFPVIGIEVSALSPAVSYNGVACNTVISLLPSGLVVDRQNYYTPALPANVIIACNA